MAVRPDVSIVIGSFNRNRYLCLTVESIRAELNCSSLQAEIIIVDGGSNDGSLNWLMKQKDIVTIVQHNRGEWHGDPIERRSWGYFMNLGFKCAQGKYICMLSDDCLVVPGAISRGVRLFEDSLAIGKKVGSMAFYWRNWPEQKRYWVGKTLGDKLFVNHGLYLRSVLEEVGFADEESYSFYHADGDLCLKMWQKGYLCIDSPDSFIEHLSHANVEVRTSNLESQSEDWESYLQKWRDVYYDATKQNAGSWLERDFEDPDDTASKFEKLTLKGWLKRPK